MIETSHLEINAAFAMNALRRLVIRYLEGGSQNLVTLDDFIDALLERDSVEGAAEPEGSRQVVRGIARGQLVDDHHLLLGARKRGEVAIGPLADYGQSGWLRRRLFQAAFEQRLFGRRPTGVRHVTRSRRAVAPPHRSGWRCQMRSAL